MLEHATESLGNRGLARTRGTCEPKVEVQRLREREQEGSAGTIERKWELELTYCNTTGRAIENIVADGCMFPLVSRVPVCRGNVVGTTTIYLFRGSSAFVVILGNEQVR